MSDLPAPKPKRNVNIGSQRGGIRARALLYTNKMPDNFGKISHDAVYESNITIAIRMAMQAKALAPVAPKYGGTLRGSIMWQAEDKQGLYEFVGAESRPLGEKPPVNSCYVGTAVEYAVYQEFGTRKMKPQPFLRPAAMIVNGSPPVEVIKKIWREKMNGPLSRGVKREEFK